ncbi:hypothetical protein GCM10014719_09920 [Planomonospora parontospora subsp. antibiotica]|nr:hypothetical protein GCM10014719_09920 [Planomonospora parontospora subsp. antibiotica]GII14706.1 hypothetical protein Ppa05_14320 [Planomonospora parontospora subsp. antibiotica]
MVMSLPRHQTADEPRGRKDPFRRFSRDTVEDRTRRLCKELNEHGYAAEIVQGQVVVSPWAHPRSCDVLDNLVDMLYPAKIRNGWRLHQSMALSIPPQGDMRLPDLVVVPRNPEYHDEMRLRGRSALLAAEVCSPGTWKTDYQEKPGEYARAGVPLYLIVDPTTEPPKVTLMSEPVEDPAPFDEREPYLKTVTVHSGGSLELPEPFSLKIDVAALFA